MNNPTFRRKLTLKILMQFVVAMAVYTAVLFVLLFLGYIVSRQIIWAPNPIYYLLIMVNNNIPLFITFLMLLGAVVLFIWFWSKTLGYLEQVISATEVVYLGGGEELVQLPKDLEEVEKQLNRIKADMEQSRQAAKEAEQRKNDLIVYLAHDLKTPLTSVIGYLTLLRDEAEDFTPEQREKYIAIGLEKAERLEELINEFFEITRLNLTAQTLQYSRVDLTRMLEQIIFEFYPTLQEKDLNCKLDAPADLLMHLDPGKIQRVFDNILRNAVGYSYPGSEIRVTVTAEDQRARIDIENRGDVIPADKLERIFDQFYRLDKSRTSATGGAGLGLAIAKQIVDQHEGSISAKSGDGITTFTVDLPGIVRKS